MPRCAGIIRGTVSPHGDGHLLDVTVSHAFGGSRTTRCLWRTRSRAARVPEDTAQREALASAVSFVKVALEPCPWSIGRLRAPDAVVAIRRSA
jgi:hypothetical protein